MPYEMFHTLHETVQMAMQELSEYYGKSATSIGANSLIPYLVLVVIKTFSLQYGS